MPELGGDEKLLHIVERWLRQERDTRPERQAQKQLEAAKKPKPTTAAPLGFGSRHMAFFR